MQEFFWILAEVVDHEPQVTRKRGHVVVESRIAEKFSNGSLIRIHFCGGVADVGGSLLHVRIYGVIRREFAERAFAGMDIVEKRIAFIHEVLRAVIHARIVNQFADRAFLVVNGEKDVIDMAEG